LQGGNSRASLRLWTSEYCHDMEFGKRWNVKRNDHNSLNDRNSLRGDEFDMSGVTFDMSGVTFDMIDDKFDTL